MSTENVKKAEHTRIKKHIAFIGNPYRPEEIYTGGFMANGIEVRSVCSKSQLWGYDGIWKEENSKPTIFLETSRRRASNSSYDTDRHGVAEGEKLKTEEEIVESIISRFRNFEEFENWAVSKGGLRMGVVHNDYVFPHQQFCGTGWYSVHRSECRLALTGSYSIQIHRYYCHRVEDGKYAVVLSGSNSIQEVRPYTIAITGKMSCQRLSPALNVPQDQCYGSLPESAINSGPAYLIGEYGTDQNGHLVMDHAGGRQVWWKNGKVCSRKLGHREIVHMIRKVIDIIHEVADKENLINPIKLTAMDITMNIVAGLEQIKAKNG